MYVFDGRYTPDKSLAGKWVEQIKSGPLLRRIQKNYLDLKPDGSVGKSKLLFWTEKMLIDNELGEARRMELFKQNRKTYLLVEMGLFEAMEEPRSEALPISVSCPHRGRWQQVEKMH